jgi:hypothetical protein
MGKRDAVEVVWVEYDAVETVESAITVTAFNLSSDTSPNFSYDRKYRLDVGYIGLSVHALRLDMKTSSCPAWCTCMIAARNTIQRF